MKSRQTRLALLGLAFGVLLALVLAPQTRWLVRLQALTALRLYHPLPVSSAPYTLYPADDQGRYETAAARRPDDYALQYALCVAGNSPDDTLKSLHALTLRFPDRPSLFANILRYEMLGKVRLLRPKEEALLNPGLRPDDSKMRYNASADLADFDQAAAAGERLDPDNAFFPWMRAVGLFAAFRDADGLAAFRRASHKTLWRDYCTDEVEARWRLHQEAFGDPGALGRVGASSALYLPHLGPLRASARLVLVKAVQEEQAGHRSEGLELRESLRRCGDLMRAQSTHSITALFGAAICAIATLHTGGMAPDTTPGLAPDLQRRRRLDAYCAYVTRLGHPEDAAQARAEEAAGQEVSAVVEIDSAARDRQLLQPFLRLTSLWSAGIAVLSNVLWLLLLGGLAARLTRSRWARRAGEGVGPAPTPMTRGAAARRGLLVVAILAAGFLLADSLLHFLGPPNPFGGIVHGIETLLLLLAIFALPPALAVRLMRHGLRPPRSLPAWRGLLRATGVVLLLGACLYGLCALVGWQEGSLWDIMEGTHSLLSLSGGGDDDQARQGTERWLSAAVFAAPLLLLLVAGAVALIRRVPLSVGLVRGFAAAALPAACLLLLVWGGLLLGTVRQEAAVNTQVWHQTHDEGPYLAAQMGKPWPGPVQ